jgi:hypothetical protein
MRAATLLFVALLCGCAVGEDQAAQEMFVKASALTKVASALEAFVRFGDAPENLLESELLRRATADDPSLLVPFENLAIRARRTGPLSSVLVCTKDRREGLLEDAGCTGKFDEHLWQRTPRPPCDFQLDLPQVCGAR